MYKILFFVGSFDLGGTERHLSQILPQLAKRGWSIEAIVLKDGGEFAPIIEDAKIPIRVLPHGINISIPKVRGLIALARQAFAVTQILLRDKPDILHCFLPTCCQIGGIAATYTKYKPIIMSRRSQAIRPSLFPGDKTLERWSLKRADAVFGHSSHVIKELKQEGIQQEKIYLNRNGIDIKSFDSQVESVQAVRNAEGWKPEETIFTMVANLIPYKGHIDLIKAFSMLKASKKSWRLVLIGTGNEDYINILKKAIIEAGLEEQVDFLGKRKDIIRLISASDVGVLASHQEGFSNAILEYMAAGLPVIATATGGNFDAIVVGKTGFLVTPNVPKELSNKIEEILKKPEIRKSFGNAGRKRVEREFSLDACVDRYETVYHKLLN